MDKTLKQIADELKIDKQKVYRFVKKNNINEAHQEHSTKYYDEATQELIKKHFLENEAHQEVHQEHINDTVYDALLKQLDIKDRQIEELQKLLNQEQQLNAMNQQKIQLLEDKSSQKKRWFWSKKDPS